jgi:hypothetical protein
MSVHILQDSVNSWKVWGWKTPGQTPLSGVCQDKKAFMNSEAQKAKAVGNADAKGLNTVQLPEAPFPRNASIPRHQPTHLMR